MSQICTPIPSVLSDFVLDYVRCNSFHCLTHQSADDFAKPVKLSYQREKSRGVKSKQPVVMSTVPPSRRNTKIYIQPKPWDEENVCPKRNLTHAYFDNIIIVQHSSQFRYFLLIKFHEYSSHFPSSSLLYYSYKTMHRTCTFNSRLSISKKIESANCLHP